MDYKRHAFPAGNNLRLQEMNSTTVTFTSSGQKMAMFLFPFGSEHCSNFAFRPQSRENILPDNLPSANTAQISSKGKEKYLWG